MFIGLNVWNIYDSSILLLHTQEIYKIYCHILYVSHIFYSFEGKFYPYKI